MLEHQSAFMDGLRGGRRMRKCMFDSIEQHHADDFANSRVGPRLYQDILSAVREAGTAEALKEFETRFLPLVNSDPSRDKGAIAIARAGNVATAAASRSRSRWVGVSVVLVVASLGGALVGFKMLKPTAAEASRSAPKMMATETKPAAVPTVTSESPVAETTPIEPASETVTEEVPVLSGKEEPPARD
jgi:hypothetical protein